MLHIYQILPFSLEPLFITTLNMHNRRLSLKLTFLECLSGINHLVFINVLKYFIILLLTRFRNGSIGSVILGAYEMSVNYHY